MYRVFHCLLCRKRLRLGAEVIRRRVRCPACKMEFPFPAKSQLRLGKGKSQILYAFLMSRSLN